ncbi:MAG: hypothetical protein GWP14_05575 [Actinobacteria bacterium]|nr:hypothetical protein [Actinomycetota bacterium]
MDDFDQQIASTGQQAQAVRRRLPVVPADNYTLLLLAGLIILLISLAYLTTLYLRYYGGLDSPRPVFGKVTAVSARDIRIDIGAGQGLSAGQQLMVLRRGVFLSDASVRTVQPEAATVSVQDETVEISAGDTVVFSPLDSQP